MRSRIVLQGLERAPHRSLFKAMGYTEAELRRPLIGVASAFSEIVPGHRPGQDDTGRAAERCLALGVAIGSGYLFPTTFEKEVYSDLTGERVCSWGAWRERRCGR